MGVCGEGSDVVRAGVVQLKNARKTDIKIFKSWYCRKVLLPGTTMMKGIELFFLQGNYKIEIIFIVNG